MARICLNMIVKNEAPVIERCLASVRPWIDHWVIVDTGSTDGTQERIRALMDGVPGQLHERPWRDFGFNRNQALELARGQADHLLFIDADETLVVPDGFAWPALTADGYQLQCRMDGWNYFRNAIVATRLPWRWQGVLHEFLTSDAPHAWANLPGPEIQVSHDGARARSPDTYLRDIEVLERALAQEPGNTRYCFYLAQKACWRPTRCAPRARSRCARWRATTACAASMRWRTCTRSRPRPSATPATACSSMRRCTRGARSTNWR
jgi:hypothetical protein